MHGASLLVELIAHYDAHMKLAKNASDPLAADAHYRVAAKSWRMAERIRLGQ